MLDDLSGFRYDLWLNVGLKLGKSAPFRAYLFLLHVVELVDSFEIVRQLIHEIVLQLGNNQITFLL